MKKTNDIDRKILSFTQGRIQRLYNSKAALARMRRCVGKMFGSTPEAFEYVLPEYEFSADDLKEQQVEVALYTVLTLYAFHQHGKDECVSDGLDENDKPISNRNTFGYAVQRLASVARNPEGVLRRFNQVLTANDLLELSVHARGLIGLMKQSGLFLDYPLLAVDFYHLQNPEERRDVILCWGKDYYMYKREEEEK